MSYGYYDSLDEESRSRYDKKLNSINLRVEECPYRLPAEVWEKGHEYWPSVEFGDIFMYLIKTPEVYNPESLKDRTSLEAHKIFSSGLVGTVYSYTPRFCHYTLLTAKVRASQPVNDGKYWPWVAAGADGQICASHCNCTTGLTDSCPHVAALLFKVEEKIRQVIAGIPCKWNIEFIKQMTPEPVEEIQPCTGKRLEKAKARNKKRKERFTEDTKEEQIQTLKILKVNGQTVVLNTGTFRGHSKDFQLKK